MHIVPVSGKGNLINAISLARGLDIPYFAVFDADMNVGKPENIEQNKTIFAVMEYAGIGSDGSLNDHLFGDYFCTWKDSIQDAILENLPGWDDEKTKVCSEFGWTTERLRKNPMVIEATLERIYQKSKIAHLERLCSAIVKRFSPAPA